jgi:hypothetical protein
MTPKMIVDNQSGVISYVDHLSNPPPPSILGGIIPHPKPDLGPLVKIRMLRTAKGSPDGIQVNEYRQGEIYEVPGRLAEIFLGENWAEKVTESHE